jgi:hypothetical protein
VPGMTAPRLAGLFVRCSLRRASIPAPVLGRLILVPAVLLPRVIVRVPPTSRAFAILDPVLGIAAWALHSQTRSPLTLASLMDGI